MSCFSESLTDQNSYNIQVLRGLAIISVCLIHCTPEGLLSVFCRPFLNFSVELFLFLSGLLSNNKTNALKRVKKVIVPFFIWSFIYVVMMHYKEPSMIIMYYAKSLITTKSAPMLYYVYVYCELSLLIPLIDKLSKSRHYWIGFLISPIEIVIMRFLPILLDVSVNEIVLVIMHVSCIGWFSIFYLGYLLGNERITFEVKTIKLFIALLFAIILQLFEGYCYYSKGVVDCGTQLKLSSLITAVIYILLFYKFIFSERVDSFKIIKILGDYSFGVFFSHIAVLRVLRKLPYFNELAVYPMNAIITLFLSFLLVYLGRRLLGRNAVYFAF